MDDGSPGSLIWCQDCLVRLAVRMWGSEMKVSEEEAGRPEENYRVRFLDSVETYYPKDRRWKLHPIDKNAEPLKIGGHDIFVTRYAGPEFTLQPHRYLWVITLGKLNQLTGGDAAPVVEDLGRMLTDLVEKGWSSQ